MITYEHAWTIDDYTRNMPREQRSEPVAAKQVVWTPVEDGLVHRDNGTYLRITDEGKHIASADPLFRVENHIFVPDDMRLCQFTEVDTPGVPRDTCGGGGDDSSCVAICTP